MVAYKFVLTYCIGTRLLAKRAPSNLSQRRLRASLGLACGASVSVRSTSKERGTRVKDRAKNGASKRAERGWKSFLPLPLLHFLALVPFLARSKPKIPFLGLSLLRPVCQDAVLFSRDRVQMIKRRLGSIQ